MQNDWLNEHQNKATEHYNYNSRYNEAGCLICI